MHALWPFGTTTFLSPMIPANVALPYAAIATGPYATATVPIFQGTQQCNIGSPLSSFSSSSSSSAAGSQQIQMPQQQQPERNLNAGGTNSGQNTSLNDSNKINIQIQCVSQNSPMNLNTIYDSANKLNLGKFCYSTACQKAGEKDSKDSNASLCNSPLPLHADDNAAGGDASTMNFMRTNSSQASANEVYLSQARFNDLRRLALRGSDIAENLAKTHRNRPCFKKIDSLCARLKQDLIRPDGVLPNINSQGIAWAVKDFIFVFTRIINAWIIIKGYVYNTPEGLNKVKAALSPDFALAFAAWQDTTMDFIESLIKSFVNLDNLVQSQKNAYQKSDISTNGAGGGGGCLNTSNSSPIKLLSTTPNILLDDNALDQNGNYLNRNYIYTMVEDSEDSQRQATVNGTYFKTGTYNPIKKDELLTTEPLAPLIANNNGENLIPSITHLPATNIIASDSIVPFQNYFNNQILDYCPNLNGNYQATDTPLATLEFLKTKENNGLNYDLHAFEENFTGVHSQNQIVNNPQVSKTNGQESKVHNLKDCIMSMQNADMFFKFQFTKNY
ncbi:protein mitoshell-like, partial [Musca vetustissima]|uniref:protein mitoshell-like n=1 Tax=Musca vetustissima TaxID=27455 RepID=UPI002AB7B1D0